MHIPKAYNGSEPYIFVSYSHRDTEQVLPIVSELQARGFRIWYDAGIEAGTEWPEYIAEHLNGCSAVLVFLSDFALESHNCRREINFSIELKKPMLVVHLTDVHMSLGMRMQLGTLQALFRYRHNSMDSFLNELCQSAVLSHCSSNTEPEVPVNLPSEIQLTAKQYDRYAVEQYDDGKAREKQGDLAGALECYKKAASSCHIQAQYEVGRAYFSGRGTNEDLSEALVWFEMAALQGDLESMFMMGTILEWTFELEQAAKWYKQAADLGHKAAGKQLAYCYQWGRGVDKDPKIAAEYYLQIALGGDPEAQAWLGNAYLEGIGVQQDDVSAVKWLKLAAPAGVASAQRQLGFCMEQGRGVPKDQSAAVEWYRRAAVQEDTLACYWLGRCYEFGVGVAEDPNEAGKWFRKIDSTSLDACGYALTMDELEMSSQETAQWHYETGMEFARYKDVYTQEQFYIAAKRGHVQAQRELADIYRMGLYYADVDLQEAFRWYSKAAENGDAQAQYQLSLFYEDGLVVDKDYKKFVSLCIQAANGGCVDAMLHYAAVTERTCGVHKGGELIYKFAKMASDHDSAEGHKALARCYEEGIGVKKNKLKAIALTHKYQSASRKK